MILGRAAAVQRHLQLVWYAQQHKAGRGASEPSTWTDGTDTDRKWGRKEKY